jgi:hypothetical protein
VQEALETRREVADVANLHVVGRELTCDPAGHRRGFDRDAALSCTSFHVAALEELVGREASILLCIG